MKPTEQKPAPAPASDNIDAAIDKLFAESEQETSTLPPVTEEIQEVLFPHFEPPLVPGLQKTVTTKIHEPRDRPAPVTLEVTDAPPFIPEVVPDVPPLIAPTPIAPVVERVLSRKTLAEQEAGRRAVAKRRMV